MQATVDKTVEEARKGKPWAVTATLDRVYPAMRDRTVSFPLRDINSMDDVGKALNDVLQAAANGDLSPSEAASPCATIIDANRKVLDLAKQSLDAHIIDAEAA